MIPVVWNSVYKSIYSKNMIFGGYFEAVLDFGIIFIFLVVASAVVTTYYYVGDGNDVARNQNKQRWYQIDFCIATLGIDNKILICVNHGEHSQTGIQRKYAILCLLDTSTSSLVIL